MRFFISIVLLALLVITGVKGQLTAKDTVVNEHQLRFDAVMESATDNTYFGYFYNNTSVWIKVHDANTHDIISEGTFKGNGKAVEYLLQSPHMDSEKLSLNGPFGETLSKQACPSPPKKRAADLFEPRASRCYQFCARAYSCTADRRCRRCRYVGGLCRWQLWCVP